MRRRAAIFLCLAAAVASVSAPSRAHDPTDEQKHEEEERAKKAEEARKKAEKQAEERPIEVQIVAERPGGEQASRLVVGRRELELRPRLRPADILEAVPGLFAVQHAGGGKANQYFLRGFDADHGTDVAFFADGVPLNMVSHGHGQGYTDFHFLIPELVVTLDAYKGPYYAQLGDFATAGAVNLKLAEKFEESFAQISIGQYGILRGVVVESPDLGDTWRAVAAAELYKQEGPFKNPEGLKRFNVFLRATHDIGKTSKIQMTWMSYGSSWKASGQLPARAVCGEGEAGLAPPAAFGKPCIDRFGYVDPTEGGSTQRHMASAMFSTAWSKADLQAMAYFVKYNFRLYSNFTFFAEDPQRGDQIEQADDRLIGGLDARFRRHDHLLGAQLTTSIGLQVRFDSIDNGLYHDVARERLQDKVKAHINEGQIGLYIEEDARIRKWLRFVLGLRAQRIDVGVDDALEDRTASKNASSGQRGSMQLLPKAMAIVSPIPQLDLFGAIGRGFHSNDARGVVLGKNAATLITPAMSYEVGVRVTPLKDLTLSASAFLLDLDSELVWVGDAGNTEASGQTRRMGVELDARYRVKNWLFADLGATFTKATFRGANNADAVPLAPTRTVSAGVSARPTFGDFTPFASFRIKHIGARPANEDRSLVAEGFTILDANAGLRWRRFEVGLDVQNMTNAKWREVQFATTSKLKYEPSPVTGIHYTPGWPITVTGRAAVYW